MAQQHSTSPDMIDDLVVSFSKLLHNASGDSDTLFKFQAMISDEIEKASNAGSLSDSRSSDVDLFASTTNPQDENTIVFSISISNSRKENRRCVALNI